MQKNVLKSIETELGEYSALFSFLDVNKRGSSTFKMLQKVFNIRSVLIAVAELSSQTRRIDYNR